MDLSHAEFDTAVETRSMGTTRGIADASSTRRFGTGCLASESRKASGAQSRCSPLHLFESPTIEAGWMGWYSN
jgi:hypothetical protein